MSASSDRVRYKTKGSQLVAELQDSQIVSWKVAGQIRESLTTALREQGSSVRAVRIDLKQVERIGSAGLNELIGFRTRARGQGLEVELSDVQPQVREVLSVTRLDRVFEVPEIALPDAE
ncbi:STAS domain-containing protein [Roseimaritima sediminicola]|uniref:STAS domain-containing protein n=1 Tax=Roseimaritima sediminicola TaxID=2662066 RepID=UPI00129830A0|nr:STAS domain-containing protein [Roseimaritima sediminicola]